MLQYIKLQHIKVDLQRVQLSLEDQRHQGVRSGPVKEGEMGNSLKMMRLIRHLYVAICEHVVLWKTEFTPLQGAAVKHLLMEVTKNGNMNKRTFEVTGQN